MSIFNLMDPDEEKLLDQLKKSEEDLLSVQKELPATWFFHKEIVEKIEGIERTVEHAIDSLKKSDAFKVQEAVEAKMDGVLVALRQHLSYLQKHLQRASNGEVSQHIPENLKASMEHLVDEIHLLMIIAAQFPVYKIGKRKILKEILKGLQERLYIPASMNYETAKKMLRWFTNTDLILALQYNTNDRPYLFISLDRAEVRMDVIKKKNPGDGLLISRLMELLGIRHMTIDYKHKMIDGKVEHLNAIHVMQGQPIITMPAIRDKKKIVAFAYLLGAACADGFVLNLEDRPNNIFIDEPLLNKVSSNPSLFLGEKNPIFHIDYNFMEANDSGRYIYWQFFGPIGVFSSSFIGKGESIVPYNQLIKWYNQGYQEELKRIIGFYYKNQRAIDALLERHGKQYLKWRFSLKNYQELLAVEDGFMEERRKTAA
ncbi:hypothetical protein HZB02_01620 [Candidatus Woesearchaeota archaeon]|nr:hypothetical protein [Candidatus Woesearchaeota archaeon]